jgi:hypothetical protein
MNVDVRKVHSHFMTPCLCWPRSACKVFQLLELITEASFQLLELVSLILQATLERETRII